MGRAPCCDKTNVKRGPWSPEEDATLKSYILQNGTGGNWIALPPKIGLKRCGKSCRLRWLNYLRPNLRHGGFSEQEDHIICSLYLSIGSRWSVIAAQLPGRTDNDIKNYWNTRLKKKLFDKQKIKEHQMRKLSAMKEETISYQHHHSIVSPIINWPHELPLLTSTDQYPSQDHVSIGNQEPILSLQNPNHHIDIYDPIIGDDVGTSMMQYPQVANNYDNVVSDHETIMVQDMFDELLSNNYQMDHVVQDDHHQQMVMTSQTGPNEWSIMNGHEDIIDNGLIEKSCYGATSQWELENMGPLVYTSDIPNLANSTHQQYNYSSCQDHNKDLLFKDIDHNYVYYHFNHV